MNVTVEIDKAGRVVVPKKIRDAMHLRAGDRLTVEFTGEKMVIEAEQKPRGLHREHGWLVFDSGVPMSAEESSGQVDEEREARARYLSWESKAP